ncbi:tripartite motif-containing protein 60-like [Acomys russatus]|uniref:tripartite motif-containing protein 60-like n=1 Tax=Acomys russatus TaxID=60746 RepID=UPI0021E2AF05|nr:tripartite motif-containing protein 60-like [Acomys russatus]
MSSPSSFSQGSAELAARLAVLQAESRCPVCKEYFRNSVTMECGHKFCLSCLSELQKDPKGSFPCPSCHFNSPQSSCSPRHTNHFDWFLENANLCHWKQIECYINLWKEKGESIEKAIATQRRTLLELKKRSAYKREVIQSKYIEYRFSLQYQQENILRQLQSDKMDGIAKQNENLAKLSDHISSLRRMLAEVKSECEKSDLALLASVNDSHERYKDLKRPRTFSFTLKEYGFQFPQKYPALDRIIQRFQVDVILDPETANCNMQISEDRKSVHYWNKQMLPNSPRRFQQPVVLGSEGYSSDRQYWEVNVERKSKWILGVCKEPFPRSRITASKNEWFSVQDGVWGVALEYPKNYVALGHKKVNFMPNGAPMRIGIFLDAEMHEVSFYSLSDRSPLYSFSDLPNGTFWPYFHTGYEAHSLKICTVTDHK